MKEELRKIEYNRKPFYLEESTEIEKEYGYFHKWISVDGNEYALIENKEGYVCMLNIFDYDIRFIKEFPKGRFIDMKID